MMATGSAAASRIVKWAGLRAGRRASGYDLLDHTGHVGMRTSTWHGAAALAAPVWGDGSGTELITMEAALAEMPNLQGLQRVLAAGPGHAEQQQPPEVQAALCAAGRDGTVMPCPLGGAHGPSPG